MIKSQNKDLENAWAKASVELADVVIEMLKALEVNTVQEAVNKIEELKNTNKGN